MADKLATAGLWDKKVSQLLFEYLQKIEPKRAKAVYNALRHIELLQRENVIMMMPFDMIYK